MTIFKFELQLLRNSAAAYLRAITIRFRTPYVFGSQLNAKQKAQSLAFNYGWIKMLMAQNFEIYDIGRDPTRVADVLELVLGIWLKKMQ